MYRNGVLVPFPLVRLASSLFDCHFRNISVNLSSSFVGNLVFTVYLMLSLNLCLSFGLLLLNSFCSNSSVVFNTSLSVGFCSLISVKMLCPPSPSVPYIALPGYTLAVFTLLSIFVVEYQFSKILLLLLISFHVSLHLTLLSSPTNCHFRKNTALYCSLCIACDEFNNFNSVSITCRSLHFDLRALLSFILRSIVSSWASLSTTTFLHLALCTSFSLLTP